MTRTATTPLCLQLHFLPSRSPVDWPPGAHALPLQRRRIDHRLPAIRARLADFCAAALPHAPPPDPRRRLDPRALSTRDHYVRRHGPEDRRPEGIFNGPRPRRPLRAHDSMDLAPTPPAYASAMPSALRAPGRCVCMDRVSSPRLYRLPPFLLPSPSPLACGRFSYPVQLRPVTHLRLLHAKQLHPPIGCVLFVAVDTLAVGFVLGVNAEKCKSDVVDAQCGSLLGSSQTRSASRMRRERRRWQCNSQRVGSRSGAWPKAPARQHRFSSLFAPS
ncbi:hypothetical protein B0H10DRAFT_326696 [Mycena sp. CBHHK59/15]|nr:hypothetical protein B0H10DRAFT_326696 [Mycena sp. CBHHK59/15]